MLSIHMHYCELMPNVEDLFVQETTGKRNLNKLLFNFVVDDNLAALLWSPMEI